MSSRSAHAVAAALVFLRVVSTRLAAYIAFLLAAASALADVAAADAASCSALLLLRLPGMRGRLPERASVDAFAAAALTLSVPSFVVRSAFLMAAVAAAISTLAVSLRAVADANSFADVALIVATTALEARSLASGSSRDAIVDREWDVSSSSITAFRSSSSISS